MNLKRLRRAPLIIVIAVTSAACTHGSAEKSPDSSAGTQASPSLATQRARFGPVPVVVQAYGTISGGPNATASLAFAEPGRLARIDVTVGEHVSAGQTLAQLDAVPYEAEVSQAQANLAAAQASYAKTAAGARPQQRAQTSAQIQQAQIQLEVAEAQLKRQQELLAAGIASQADVDAAKAAQAVAQAQLRVLQQQQSAELHPLPQDVMVASAQVGQAQAALEAARQHLAYASLTAPFAGVVTARLHSAGESVDQNTPVIQMAGNGPAVFTAEFSPADASKIRVGSPATVEFQDSHRAEAGSVTAISSAQTVEGRLVPVLIRLRSSYSTSGSGAYGQASVRIGLAQGLLVPASAVVADPTTGATLVFRRHRDQYSPIPVEVKSTIGEDAWIVSTALHAGDIVVTRGAAELMAPPAAKPEE